MLSFTDSDSRLLRLFTTFSILAPSENALFSIYNHKILSWLDEFPNHLCSNKKELAQVGNYNCQNYSNLCKCY